MEKLGINLQVGTQLEESQENINLFNESLKYVDFGVYHLEIKIQKNWTVFKKAKQLMRRKALRSM